MSHQYHHVHKLIHLLKYNGGMYDVTRMGNGKTYTALCVARNLHYPNVLVFGPSISASGWRDAVAHFEMDPDHVRMVPYSMLLNRKRNQDRHNDNTSCMLYVDKDGKRQFSRWVLPFVQHGVTVIIDEAHMLKHASTDRSNSVLSLLQWIRKNGVGHRVLCLSGTPLDKEEQLTGVLRLLGVVSKTYMYRRNITKGTANGTMVEMVRFVQRNNRNATKEMNILMYKMYHGRESISYESMYRLFKRHVRDYLFHHMPNMTRDNTTVTNGFFALHDQLAVERVRQHESVCIQALEKYDELVNSTIRMRGNNDAATVRRDAWLEMNGQVSKSLEIIENAKAEIFLRECIALLEGDPSKHVVLMVNYLSTYRLMCQSLVMYRPLCISGSVTMKRRMAMIEKFQSNSLEHRLIVCTRGTLNSSVNLHDQWGDCTRSMRISPSGFATEMEQTSERCNRCTSMSRVDVCYMYCKDITHEKTILDRICKKRNTMQDVIPYNILMREDLLYRQREGLDSGDDVMDGENDE